MSETFALCAGIISVLDLDHAPVLHFSLSLTENKLQHDLPGKAYMVEMGMF